MNPPPSPVRWSVIAYRGLLRLLPAWFGRRFRDEATRVFADVAADVHARRGFTGLSLLWIRTLVDIARGTWQERATYWSVWGALPNLRIALRSLRLEPWFSAAVVMTIALGVGSTTAIYTIAYDILLRPLPFPGSERVVALCEIEPQDVGYCVASPPNVRDLGELTASIEAAGVARTWRFRMQEGAEHSSWTVGIATPGFLMAHDVRLAYGRLFNESELVRGANHVIVLTNALWQRWAGADPDVVGRRVTLDAQEFLVIGVLAPDTRIPQFEHAEAWAPVTTSPDNPDQRDWRGFVSVARVAPGIGIDQTRDELRATYASLAQEYPEVMKGLSLNVERLRDQLAGDARPMIRLFGLAVVCLLLIGCANVANLLIVRSQTRVGEVAVRAALGAGRVRLAAQLLAESLILAVFGGAAGLALATGLVKAAVSFAPAGIPRLEEVAVDANVAVFAMVLSLVTALLFGLIPAMRVARADIGGLLRGGRFGDRDAARIRRGILVLELALAMTLLTGAGLGIRGFAGLLRWDPGFDRSNLVTTWASADITRYKSGVVIAERFSAAARALESIPGIESVGQSSAGPLFGGIETGILKTPGRESGKQPAAVQMFDIDAEYFGTLGVPIVSGRGITSADDAGSARVAVVNEAFVRRHWPDASPIGAEIVVNDHAAVIVGVVGDMRPFQPNEPVRPAVYWPRPQYTRGATYFLIRTAYSPQVTERLARERLGSEFDGLEFRSFGSLQERADRALVSPRFQVMLLATFAAAALLLAAVGVYAIVAYGVAQETHEIGLRIALGARPGSIVGRVIGRGVRLAAVGGVLGVAGAWVLTRWLESILHGVSSTDPATLVGVAAVFVLVAVVASWLPARRAGSVDPATALRGD